MRNGGAAIIREVGPLRRRGPSASGFPRFAYILGPFNGARPSTHLGIGNWVARRLLRKRSAPIPIGRYAMLDCIYRSGASRFSRTSGHDPTSSGTQISKVRHAVFY